MFILRSFTDDDLKNSTSGKPMRRLNFNEVTTLKGTVAKSLNNSPIGKTYIKDLIERVAFNTGGTVMSTDINRLFEMVAASRGDNPLNGGIWIYLQGSATHSAGNTWDWVGGKGFGEVYMSFSGDISWKETKLPEEQKVLARHNSVLRYLVDPFKGGMSTIHELMHVAVKGRNKKTLGAFGGDIDYADAAAMLAGDTDPTYAKAEYPGDAGSAYWGERLNQSCGYPSHITHKMTDYILYKSKTPFEPEVPIEKTLPSTIARK